MWSLIWPRLEVYLPFSSTSSKATSARFMKGFGMGISDRGFGNAATLARSRAQRPDPCHDAPVKAAVFTRYGPPGDVVELRDVEMPSPNEGEVRIAIRAASINALDWRTVTGTPVLAR